MVEIKEECCGCGACAAVCPKGAVEMAADGEGFAYPQIDEGKCIRCGLCEKVCPMKRKEDSGKNEK